MVTFAEFENLNSTSNVQQVGCNIIGITHVFSCIDICPIRGNCLNMRPPGLVFKHLLRDLASINALIKCVIVILSYFASNTLLKH